MQMRAFCALSSALLRIPRESVCRVIEKKRGARDRTKDNGVTDAHAAQSVRSAILRTDALCAPCLILRIISEARPRPHEPRCAFYVAYVAAAVRVMPAVCRNRFIFPRY